MLGFSLGRWLVLASAAFILSSEPIIQETAPPVGYAEFTPDPGEVGPTASALFRLEMDGGLVSEAAVDAAPPIRRGRIFVDQTESLTGVAIANPSDETVPLRLTLRNSSGVSLAVGDLQIEARHHTAIFVDQLFPGLAEGLLGTMTFESSSPTSPGVAAVTVRQGFNGRGEPLFATLPVTDLDTAEPAGLGGSVGLLFPHVGAGGPLTTQIVLINPFPEQLSGQIQLSRSDGSELTVEAEGEVGSIIPYAIAPNGSFQVTLRSLGEITQGQAQLTVEQGPGAPGGTAIFQFRDGEGRLVSEAGVGAGAVTGSARVFIDLVRTRTGVAIANPNREDSIDLVFELYSRDGSNLEVASRQLPPNGHLALFADELFPKLTPLFTGVMEIRSDGGFVPVTLKLSANPRGEPILTTLPVLDLESAIPEGVTVIPQVGSGPGFSTRLLLLSRDRVESIEGEVSLTRSDGFPLEFFVAGKTDNRFRYRVNRGGSRQFRLGNTSAPAEIVVDPSFRGFSEVAVNVGNSFQLSPVVIDDAGLARDDFELTYESLNPEIATVDGHGVIEALEPGFSTLTVGAGNILQAATITAVAVATGSEGFGIEGVAQDFALRLFMANPTDNTILLGRDLSRSPELYAGQESKAGLKDGPKLQALFSSPAFAALNQATGQLYVSDSGNHVVRVVGAGSRGEVSTLAGTGLPGHLDGPLESARFDDPQGLALDRLGNLWVADRGNHTVRRIRLADGVVETVAGSPGEAGFSDGTGENARFNFPTGLSVEPEPLGLQLARALTLEPPPPVSVLVADTENGRIRRVFEDGRVETVDPAPSVPRRTEFPTTRLGLPAGARFERPESVVADPFGRIYVTEPENNEVLILLSDGRRAPLAQRGTFVNPRSIAVTQAGQVAVTDSGHLGRSVRFGVPEVLSIENAEGEDGVSETTLTGRNFAPDTIAVVPGSEILDLRVLDSTRMRFVVGDSARLSTTLTVLNRGGSERMNVFAARGFIANRFSLVSWTLEDLALDSLGRLVILTPSQVHVSPAGTDGRLLIAGFHPDEDEPRLIRLEDARGVDVDFSGSLYVADAALNQVFKISPETRTVETVAGSGEAGFDGDGGPGRLARLNGPQGVRLDGLGNLLVADTLNQRIRRIGTDGQIATVAGNGDQGYSGDGGAAVEAALNNPNDTATDRDGNIYIADTGNHRIRRVDSETGAIETIAGTGEPGFSGDGGPATEAKLDTPEGIDVDIDGNVFVGVANRVRRIDATTGIITTVAGGGDSPVGGVPATDYDFFSGVRVRIDSAGNLFIIGRRDFGTFYKVDAVTGLIEKFQFDPTSST